MRVRAAVLFLSTKTDEAGSRKSRCSGIICDDTKILYIRLLCYYLVMNENLQGEIQSLKDRNKRVELDKAWEVSWTRRGFIVLITYLIASMWLHFINENDIWLKAVVPTGGYILSTLSIPLLKKIWIRNKTLV